MVEHTFQLDHVFSSLADPTRRDILMRVARKELSIGEVAEPYDMTLAAVSKHLAVLQKAKLIRKRRRGKQQFIRLIPHGLKEANLCLRRYQVIWEDQLDSLEEFLKKTT